jgi:hypothetical protein
MNNEQPEEFHREIFSAIENVLKLLRKYSETFPSRNISILITDIEKIIAYFSYFIME